MRSAEFSDAGANGFGTSDSTVKTRRAAAPVRVKSFGSMLSPVTTAVGLTSMLAASLFMIYDTARTLDDARGAIDLANVTQALQSFETAGLAPETTLASMISSEGGPMDWAAMSSQFAPAGQPIMAGGPDLNVAWSDIMLRAAIVFGAAALLTFATWRRRKPDLPDAHQKQHYQTLASAIPMGVACWTQSGDLIVCNEQFGKRLNLGSRAVAYHDVVKRLIAGGYMKLLNEDQDNRLLELHREDGSCLLIDERPLDDGGFMTLVSDVTERKKTDTLLTAIREEQRLLARRYHEEKIKAEAASRSKTNFLAHLSHDIRTPLNHIIGFAELMRHQTYGPLGDPRYVDYVQTIKTSGEHLLSSFGTILDLAEMDSGQKTLRSDPVSVDQLMTNVVQKFRDEAERRAVSFQLGQKCGAIVQGDRLGLTRMLSNIVENSLRFTPAGGRISLAGFAARDGVVIEITDTGIGMDEDRLASLSQPFALGDATFTREGIGPGLGISISRAIAELTGGHMAIDSSPALGTTVAISLPLQHSDVLQAAE